MSEELVVKITIGVAGALPAILFHLLKKRFLESCVLSSFTASWTVFLLLLFSSGRSWGLSLVGAIVWLPAFFLVSAAVGIAVRASLLAISRQPNHHRKCENSNDVARTKVG